MPELYVFGEADFAAYLEEVRSVHKQKRNFMKLLDQVKWR